ncbi:MAG: sugar transferase [Epsilonproteobacteria bacterium]|nr:MAG: sugar transferase [Campylobacterota bacterium]
MTLAPIVLFVYNRPWHTQQTVEALQKNELASESELFIYSDEAKNEDVRKNVDEVRKYIDNVNGFKKVTVIKREKNWGLANNIIDGVTNIVNKYSKIIVLEDDLVTSPYFLKFMNEALKFYRDEKKIWHISGWNYPISTDRLDDVFLWQFMNCWGWATWANRWKFYEKNIPKTINDFTKKDRKKFNLDGVENFWDQVITNKEGRTNTWAIFWYAKIFKQNGLCLNPSETLVENIGRDGSGENCGKTQTLKNILSQKNSITFDTKIIENNLAYKRIQIFYKSQKKAFWIRMINKLARMSIKRNLIK